MHAVRVNHKDFFHSIIMMRFGERERVKEKFFAAKKPIKIWDANADNIVISKLVKTKTNCKYKQKLILSI